MFTPDVVEAMPTLIPGRERRPVLGALVRPERQFAGAQTQKSDIPKAQGAEKDAEMEQ
jgi:hypothetical protein